MSYFRSRLGRLLSSRFIDNPIFIAGTGRSGTSIVLQALGKHPAVLAMQGEAPFITSIGGGAALFYSEEKGEYYRQSLMVPLDYFHDQMRRMALEVAGGTHYAWRRVLKGVLREGKKPWRIDRWCAKTFPNQNVMRGLEKLYPEMNCVYVVRNGIEVVNSMGKFHGFSGKQFEDHCAIWAHGVEYYRFLSEHPKAVMVRHEELVVDPVKVFDEVFALTGLSPTSAPADFLNNNVVHPLDKPNQSDTSAKEMFSRRDPPHIKWDRAQREFFKSICGKGMKELGYEIPF